MASRTPAGRSGSPARARVVGLFAAAILVVASVGIVGAPFVAAVGPIAVTGTGTASTGFSQTPTRTLTINATDDGAGHIGGTFSIADDGISIASGQISCMTVSGTSAIVGGFGQATGGINGPASTVFFITDNAPIYGDTLDSTGYSMDSSPSCAVAPPPHPQFALQSGNFTIGPPGPPPTPATISGTVVAPLSPGSQTPTRTLTINATTNAVGQVSGTFSETQTQGFSISGTVTCMIVNGTSVIVGGSGPSGSGTTFAAVYFIHDIDSSHDTVGSAVPDSGSARELRDGDGVHPGANRLFG